MLVLSEILTTCTIPTGPRSSPGPAPLPLVWLVPLRLPRAGLLLLSLRHPVPFVCSAEGGVGVPRRRSPMPSPPAPPSGSGVVLGTGGGAPASSSGSAHFCPPPPSNADSRRIVVGKHTPNNDGRLAVQSAIRPMGMDPTQRLRAPLTAPACIDIPIDDFVGFESFDSP